MERRHDWTLRPELMRPRAVPVSTWPTIADIPQGAIVLDTDGVVKQCRYVANLDGADAVDFGFALPSDGTTGPWELEWLMAIDGIPSSFESFFESMVAGLRYRHFRVSLDYTTSKIYSDWRSSSAASFVTRSAVNITDGKFRKFLVVVSSDLQGRFFVDDVQQGTEANLSSWAPGTATAFKITGAASSGTKSYTKIANLVASRNGVPLANIPFSEGVGTVANDKSGNGYNGVIADVSPLTFWTKALVPVSML